MDSHLLSIAELVVARMDRAHPADSVLRTELKAQPGLTRKDSTQVARAVFSHSRWKGWLDPAQSIRQQIVSAVDLADRFAKRPESFSDPDLVARAGPAWARDEIELTAGLARVLQTEPRLWIRARPGQGTVLARKLGHCRPAGAGLLADTLVYLGREDLFRTPEFYAGEFELQDISSQAVGLICAPVSGQTWWDACAGEGGKTLHLADLMGNQGLIWASDRAQWRLAKLRRRAARAKLFNYRSAIWDGGPRLPTRTKFDGVLVDAPCSGSGTWQRNPQARWTLTKEDLNELAALQLKLLAHAAQGVKPGGKLLYSVCSLARSETSGVIESFEARCPGFARLLLANPLDAGRAPARTILFWPQQFEGNGMLVAAWTRIS